MIAYQFKYEVSQHPRILAALSLCQKLRDAGWQAWWVGGCVRDLLLNPDTAPKDVDVATNANLRAIQKIFPGTISIGKAFGVGLVKINDFSFEVAMFRKESEYTDRRHPSKIEPGSLVEDSARRDFTINSLYLDPVSHEIADFHDGLSDLKKGQMRCVGEPYSRLHEDPLRILRLFRFSSNLNFEIEPETLNAAYSLKAELSHISRERILLEISKVRPESINRFKDYFKIIQSSVLGLAPHLLHELYAEKIKNNHHNTTSIFSLPEDINNFPGTLLVLMCIDNEGFSARDWRSVFKSWPFSLKEKAHLELILRISVDGFMLPSSNELKLSHSSWLNWLEQTKWLFRQNRILISEANWIIKNLSLDDQDQQDLLKKICSLGSFNDGHLTIASAIEANIAQAAKFYRSYLQDWSKDKPKEALGWARLLMDISALLDFLQIEDARRPALFSTSNSDHFKDICAVALDLSNTQNSKKKRIEK